tara:strand:+ start:227 stop:346 length:120 start_codon:yes stop_codon:yes gene_type:complete
VGCEATVQKVNNQTQKSGKPLPPFAAAYQAGFAPPGATR